MWLGERGRQQLVLGTHFCGSLASEDVFVTDLARICVLSPNGHQQERVLCVQRHQIFKELVFSLGTMCSLYLYLHVNPLLLGAEKGRSAHQGASQAMPVPRIQNVQQRRELGAPAATRHLKLSWPTVKTSPLIWEEACILGKVNQSLYFRLPS